MIALAGTERCPLADRRFLITDRVSRLENMASFQTAGKQTLSCKRIWTCGCWSYFTT